MFYCSAAVTRGAVLRVCTLLDTHFLAPQVVRTSYGGFGAADKATVRHMVVQYRLFQLALAVSHNIMLTRPPFLRLLNA